MPVGTLDGRSLNLPYTFRSGHVRCSTRRAADLGGSSAQDWVDRPPHLIGTDPAVLCTVGEGERALGPFVAAADCGRQVRRRHRARAAGGLELPG